MAGKKNDVWYSEGLCFECSQCGDCCTGAEGYVWVNQAEIDAMSARMHMTPEVFEKQNDACGFLMYTGRVSHRGAAKEAKGVRLNAVGAQPGIGQGHETNRHGTGGGLEGFGQLRHGGLHFAGGEGMQVVKVCRCRVH